MKTNFKDNLSRAVHKGLFQVKKHSPEILVVTGIVTGVASAVMACMATPKVSFVLEDTKKKIDIIHEGVENGEVLSSVDNEIVPVEYTKEDSKKDLAIVYAQTGLELVKLYGPAVALGAFSVGCILTGTNILRKRNIALAAAYATEHLGFKEYRERVVERFGKDLDRELKYNIKAREIEETVVNEDGTEQTITKTVDSADPNLNSLYARFFDDGCTGWTKNAEDNLQFLKLQQSYANRKLQAQGYLYLNDVYEMLGIPKTKAGHVVGWIYDEAHPIGDNYVDFGMYDIYNEKARDFVNGRERTILLDFNVDGNIWELMQ